MTDVETPTLLLGDLEAVIRDHARGAKRSQQVELGPSEVGQACERKLALTLLGAPKTNDDRDEWTSSVGTACHTWMEGALLADNARLLAAGEPVRWLVEQTVTVRPGMNGHCDAYDLRTHTVLDHKFPGVTSIRKYRKQGHPGRQYQWQAHLYGMGWANIGMPVQNVAIACYPRSGLTRDTWLWTEPYSPAIAEEALARLDALLTALDIAEGAGELEIAMGLLDRDTTNCSWCPFWTGGPGPAPDPTLACAGAHEDPTYASTRARATAIEGIY